METPPATSTRYSIDAGKSTFTVRAFATGLLSAFAHSPTIKIPEFEGEIAISSPALEDASLHLVIRPASMVVTGDFSAKDRNEIEQRIRDEVLEVDSFSAITYDCPRLASTLRLGEGLFTATLDGQLSMHGVTKDQKVVARITLSGDMLRAGGEFSIKQSDYEIKPVTAAGGTIKLKDELKLSFDISARRQP